MIKNFYRKTSSVCNGTAFSGNEQIHTSSHIQQFIRLLKPFFKYSAKYFPSHSPHLQQSTVYHQQPQKAFTGTSLLEMISHP